jgi:ribose transport system substrate-binding protein
MQIHLNLHKPIIPHMNRPRSGVPFFDFAAVAISLGGFALLSAANATDNLTDPTVITKAFPPKASDTASASFKAKKAPYKIAFSNSYFGNNWRAEMLKAADAYVKQPQVQSFIKEYRVYNAGNDVGQQIAQIRQIILSGADAIVVNAASPTGLDSVLEEAVNRGIVVVAFDNTVGTKKVVNVNNDQAAMGKRWAKFLADQIKGQGTVLMIHGVAGTTVDNDQANGAMSVFKQHPDIKVIDVYGNWDVGTNQKVAANALATYPKIDAVWGTEGCTGVIQAFLQLKRPLVPMTGESDNGFMRLVVENKIPALVIGQPPAMAAAAIRVAINLLSGNQLPQEISLPLEEITTEQMKAGVNYFPAQPDSLITDFSIPSCDVQIPVEQVVR